MASGAKAGGKGKAAFLLRKGIDKYNAMLEQASVEAFAAEELLTSAADPAPAAIPPTTDQDEHEQKEEVKEEDEEKRTLGFKYTLLISKLLSKAKKAKLTVRKHQHDESAVHLEIERQSDKRRASSLLEERLHGRRDSRLTGGGAARTINYVGKHDKLVAFETESQKLNRELGLGQRQAHEHLLEKLQRKSETGGSASPRA